MWIFEKPISRTTRQGVGEIGVGFAGEADDDVGRERRPIERFLHQPAAVDDSLGAPAAAHAAQHGVGAALQRDVQMRANFFGIRGHHGDQFARDFGGFDAREADAEIAGQFGDLLHEIGKPDPFVLRPAAVPFDAVVAQMNAGENQFAIAAVDEPADFVENVLAPAGWKNAAALAG